MTEETLEQFVRQTGWTSPNVIKVWERIFSVNQKVRAKLSYTDQTDYLYEGKIEAIFVRDDGRIYIDIRRNDGEGGDGFRGTWRTEINQENIEDITVLSEEWDN